MSTNTNGGDEEIPSREVAYRLFAAEYDDASLSHTESDEERAPNYVVTPTGARTNRVFVVGTLTEVTDVNEEMVRARVVDPTGAFVVYAGQYQPDELAFLEQVTPPAFVAVTGKARTFEPDDGDRVFTSVRPESIATVDAETRDRWVVSAAERTLERIGTYASAADLDARGDDLATALREAGVDRGLAAGIPLAQDHYGTTPDYLAAVRDCALEAVESVAGDRADVTAPSIAPDKTTPGRDASFATLSALVDLGLDLDRDEPAGESDTLDGSAGTVADSSPERAETRAGSAEPSADSTADDPEPVTTDDGLDEDPTASVEAPAEPTGSNEVEATDPADDSVDDATVDDSTPVTETTEIESAATADDDPSPASETVEFDSDADADDDLDDFGPGMYEMDDDEREQLEAEFGAEFTTGAEVDEPGEAGLETEPAAEAATDDAPAASAEPTDADPLEASADSSADADDDLETAPESTLDADDSSSFGAATESSFESADEPETDDTVEEDDPAVAEADTDEAAGAGERDESTAADEVAADVDLQSYVVDTMTDLDDGNGADREELVASVVADTGASSEAVEDAIQDALMGGQCYEPDDGVLKAI